MTINSVEAARGAAWLTEGFDFLKRSIAAWIGVTILFVIIMVLLSRFRIGDFIFQVVSPVFAGGLMLGCKSQDDGGPLDVKHLFAGFSGPHFGQLVLVGVLYFVGLLAVMLVSMFLVALAAGGAALVSALQSGDMTAAAAYPVVALLLLLIVAALLLPLLMAIWFAPALVVLRGMPAVTAMRESFRGCLYNWLPFLIYGVVALVFAILATIPLGLGWLILMPLLVVSAYLGYKDIFGEEPGEVTAPG